MVLVPRPWLSAHANTEAWLRNGEECRILLTASSPDGCTSGQKTCRNHKLDVCQNHTLKFHVASLDSGTLQLLPRPETSDPKGKVIYSIICERIKLLKFAYTPVMVSSTAAKDALRALWSAAFPEEELHGLISEQWKDMGWQGLMWGEKSNKQQFSRNPL
ncbi:hypothetical protein JHK82_043484 [Glycine max]|nr:hypothetical protein JHK82_043484 [Glycine max]KAG5117439.1 hypothetical protein JHK84_043552 [Glycine max]